MRRVSVSHMRGPRRTVNAPSGRVSRASPGMAVGALASSARRPRRRLAATGITSDEMNGRQAHTLGTFVLSLLMAGIGLALIGQCVTGHASVISPRLLLGVLFIAAGAGRGYVEIRRSRGL